MEQPELPDPKELDRQNWRMLWLMVGGIVGFLAAFVVLVIFVTKAMDKINWLGGP